MLAPGQTTKARDGQKAVTKMSINFDEMPKDDKGVEQVELFKLNGVSYTIPNKRRANVSLRYLNISRRDGQEAATSYLLETMIGAEGYEALMDYDDLTTEQFEQIVAAAQKVVIGESDSPKAKR